MSEEVIRIAEFRSNDRADIARVVLDGNGILSEVLLVPTEGDRGAFVLVRKEDARLALAVLKTAGFLNADKRGIEH